MDDIVLKLKDVDIIVEGNYVSGCILIKIYVVDYLGENLLVMDIDKLVFGDNF